MRQDLNEYSGMAKKTMSKENIPKESKETQTINDQGGGSGSLLCVAGCMAFDGGEKRHHKDCLFFAESFSKRYDDLKKEMEQPAKPNLGRATTRELLDEIRARIEIDGNLDYKTINET